MDVFTGTVGWFADPTHWSGPNGIPVRLLEHIALSGTSLIVALVVALPTGLWIGHTGRAATFVVNVANLWRSLPSLAVIALVLPITAAVDPQAGFKVYPTFVAMIVLAVPPVLVNTYAAVAGVDRDLVEAARGMGMRGLQVLTQVELPVGVPVIVAGIRSAAVQIVATATLGAIFGFGGLGRYIVDGTAQNDDPQVFGGVVLVAGLAIGTELAFGLVQRLITPRGLRLERERERATAARELGRNAA